MVKYIFGIFLIMILIIILSVIFYKKKRNSCRKPIGGCAGTRHGCCPFKNIAKHDEEGSNCYKINI